MILKQMKVSLSGISELLKDDISMLSLLYDPLCESKILKLYYMLISLNGLKVSTNYEFISNVTKMELDEILQARQSLEKLMLIRTYSNELGHQIVIYPPKSVYEFLKHEVLGRYYLQVMGSDVYHEIIAYFQVPSPIMLGKEISESFDSTIFRNYSKKQETEFQEVVSSSVQSNFNQQLFLQIASKTMFPESLRTHENLVIIEEMFNRYQPTMREMVNMVARAITKDNQFDKDYFRILFLDSIIDTPMDNSNPLKWTSEQFLQAKQPEIPILDSEIKLIDLLRSRYHLSDELINVILNHALSSGKGILNKNYLEKVATTFVRNKISSIKEAQEFLSYDNKTTKTPKKAVKKVQYQVDEKEKADPKEIEAILNKLKKGT